MWWVPWSPAQPFAGGHMSPWASLYWLCFLYFWYSGIWDLVDEGKAVVPELGNSRILQISYPGLCISNTEQPARIPSSSRRHIPLCQSSQGYPLYPKAHWNDSNCSIPGLFTSPYMSFFIIDFCTNHSKVSTHLLLTYLGVSRGDPV